MVAQVAADEPDTAAKIVQPMMLVCSNRPGTRSSQGASPLNMSSDSRVRKRISPIQTKSGSAVSVQDDAVPQIVTAIASPAEREEKSAIAVHATPASASPIQTPLPSSANSATINSVVTKRSLDMCRLLSGRRKRTRSRQFAHQLIDESDREDHGARSHRELRQPERRRVVSRRDVVERVRLPCEPDAEVGKEGRQDRRGAQR